jgi:hypothetical protein
MATGPCAPSSGSRWSCQMPPPAARPSPSFGKLRTAISDPTSTQPLLVATPLALSPQVLRDLYRDRWPVEQIPLAAKQMLGAARQFVHEQETCQRFPELALLAGAVLTYAAATSPAVPTGSWDRQPQRTPGRLRRLLAQANCPKDFPLPGRLRVKLAVTDHLPKGYWGQRRHPPPTAASSGAPDQLPASPNVA